MRLIAWMCALALIGCGLRASEEVGPLSPSLDGGTEADGGPPDAGAVPDAGVVPDAGLDGGSTALRVLINASYFSAAQAHLRAADVLGSVANRAQGQAETPLSDAGFEAIAGCLSSLPAHVLGVEKSMTFSSLEDFRRFKDRIPVEVSFVSYNTEVGLTPQAERADVEAIVRSVQTFALEVRATGRKMAWGPAGGLWGAVQSAGRLDEVLSSVDALGVQGQNVLSSGGLEALRTLLKERRALLRAANPRGLIHAQLWLGNNSAAEVVQAFNDPEVRQNLDLAIAFAPGSMSPSTCATVGSGGSDTAAVLGGLQR